MAIRLRFQGDDVESAEEYLRALNPGLANELFADKRSTAETRWIGIESKRSEDPDLLYDRLTGVRHGEGYQIQLGSGNGRIRYATDRGLRNAVATLAQLIQSGAESVDIIDAPRFRVRGVIEGYYGVPWTADQRQGVMRLLASRKMNAYFYGPKDDRYHRKLWREPYPKVARRELSSLVDYARRLGLDFWYTIGPGLSMEYSSETDFQILVAKLESVRMLGVSRFGLLFDDIPANLQHTRDREQFSGLAMAHATVANRLYRELRERDAQVRLVVCPTEYSGRGDESSIAELGELLDPRIEVFWTGPEICSRELTLRDASLLTRTLNRPPLYWDNYPVNDLQMRDELHLGPYRGRDAHLYRMSLGIVVNVMENAEVTKIPLLTVADYLWNPEAYEPEASWRTAIKDVVGSNDADAFLQFADCNRYSALYRTDAPNLARELQQADFLRTTGHPAEAITVLRAAIVRLERASQLFDRGMENQLLQGELGRWIAAYRAGIGLLSAVAEELGRREPDTARLARCCATYKARPAYTYGDVLDPLVREFDRAGG
jgi:hyaluronoglucosaminidase